MVIGCPEPRNQPTGSCACCASLKMLREDQWCYSPEQTHTSIYWSKYKRELVCMMATSSKSKDDSKTAQKRRCAQRGQFGIALVTPMQPTRSRYNVPRTATTTHCLLEATLAEDMDRRETAPKWMNQAHQLMVHQHRSHGRPQCRWTRTGASSVRRMMASIC